MSVSLAFHIIGIVMWLGGLLLVTRFMALTCADGPSDDVRAAVKKLFFGWAMGGLALATLTGLYQISYFGMGHYMKQGWFHGKLTLLIVLYVVSFLTLKQVKGVSSGENVHPSKVMALHGISGLCLFIMVLLTMVGRLG